MQDSLALRTIALAAILAASCGSEGGAGGLEAAELEGPGPVVLVWEPQWELMGRGFGLEGSELHAQEAMRVVLRTQGRLLDLEAWRRELEVWRETRGAVGTWSPLDFEAHWLDGPTLLLAANRRGRGSLAWSEDLLLFDCAAAEPRLLAVALSRFSDLGEEPWERMASAEVFQAFGEGRLQIRYQLESEADPHSGWVELGGGIIEYELPPLECRELARPGSPHDRERFDQLLEAANDLRRAP